MQEIKKCDMNRPYAFVSYAHEDTDKVLEVVSLLTKKGYNIWLDNAGGLKHDGNDWLDNALKAMVNENLKLAIFFRSENSMIKNNIETELRLLKSQLGPEGIMIIDIWNDSNLSVQGYEIQLLKEKKTDEIRILERIIASVSSEANAVQYSKQGIDSVIKTIDEENNNIGIDINIEDNDSVKSLEKVSKIDKNNAIDNKDLNFIERLNLAFCNAIQIDDKRHFANYLQDHKEKERKCNGAAVIMLPSEYQKRIWLESDYDETNNKISIGTVAADTKKQLGELVKSFKRGKTIKVDPNETCEIHLILTNAYGKHPNIRIAFKNNKNIDYDILQKSFDISGRFKSYEEYEQKVNNLIALWTDEKIEIKGMEECNKYVKNCTQQLSLSLGICYKINLDIKNVINQDKNNGYKELVIEPSKDEMAKLIYDAIVKELIF